MEKFWKYDHQTKTAGCGRGKGNSRGGKKKSRFLYHSESGEYTQPEYLHLFPWSDIQKIYKIDVKKLKRENTGFYQQMKLLSLENRQKNHAYIKENGIGRFSDM